MTREQKCEGTGWLSSIYTRTRAERSWGSGGSAIINVLHALIFRLACVRRRMSVEARNVVVKRMGEVNIRFHELPFYPSRVTAD